MQAFKMNFPKRTGELTVKGSEELLLQGRAEISTLESLLFPRLTQERTGPGWLILL